MQSSLTNELTVLGLTVPSTLRQLLSRKGKGGDAIAKEDQEHKRVTPGEAPALRPTSGTDGSIAAADSSHLNDGASALVLMSAEKAKDLGLEPLARFVRTSKSRCSGVHSTDNLFSFFWCPCKSYRFPWGSGHYNPNYLGECRSGNKGYSGRLRSQSRRPIRTSS